MKAPVRPEECFGGSAEAEHTKCPKDYYRAIYYEALDHETSCIKSRFDQKDYKMYAACLLLKSITDVDFSDELKNVT